jgi:hypothetical protein
MHMKKLFFFLFVTITSFSFAQAQAPADTTLKQYIGTYNFPDGSVVASVMVALEQSGLTMSSSAGTSELRKLGVDTFMVVSFEGTAVFKRNADKKIIGVTIDARGYLLEGTRSEPTGMLLRRKQD